jgi:Kdo2-lipid IVA lauroyltransferase/acyltransferase
LHWCNERHEGRLAYASVRKIKAYKIRYFGSRATYWRCDLSGAGGRRIRLQAAHVSGGGRIEDRTASYIPFIKQLEANVAAANPHAVFSPAVHWVACVDAVLGSLLVVALRVLRRIDLDLATAAVAALARRIGPRLKGHRVARSNLSLAFPEKSAAEIEHILAGMWDNLGRVLVEYAHLDRLWDFDPAAPHCGRIIIEGDDRRRYLAAFAMTGPVLFFGAHCANWELLVWSVGARSRGAVVYRPPKIAALDRELRRIRNRSKTILIAANVAAPFAVKELLRCGGSVGMLVDEHFARGMDVNFFGRSVKVSSLFGRFARGFDCTIVGARVVRLAGGRFRLDISDPIVPPRDNEGKIDIVATMQNVTDIIEGWVREHPEQWLWMQRRWR